jgi:hypothetical protein
MNATAQWRRRVLRISSLCEIVFGTLWLANGIRPHVSVAGIAVLAAGTVGFVVSLRATRGIAPRPVGAEASVLERKVTIATAVQIGVSIVVPAALIVVGRSESIMPFVIVSVGALFVYLFRLLRVPRLGLLGAALVVVPIAALAGLSGSAQTTVTLVGAGMLMVANAAVGVRALADSGYWEGSQRKRRIATTSPATPHTATTAR